MELIVLNANLHISKSIMARVKEVLLCSGNMHLCQGSVQLLTSNFKLVVNLILPLYCMYIDQTGIQI